MIHVRTAHGQHSRHSPSQVRSPSLLWPPLASGGSWRPFSCQCVTAISASVPARSPWVPMPHASFTFSF